MTWARLDDRANEHRKQLAAGAEACWLWACGLMYANRQDARDGFIPEPILAMLYPFRNPKRLAAKLVEVGLWDRVPGGYRVHDYHGWNPTREQVELERAKGRERAKRSYEKRRPSSSAEDLESSSPEDATKKPVSSGVEWSGSGSGPEGVQREGPTLCPLDLADRAVKVGVVSDLAAGLKADPAAVLACVQEFVAYWTIGGGAGDKRDHWMKRLRKWVCEQHGQGKLRAQQEPSPEQLAARRARDRFEAEEPARAAARLQEAIARTGIRPEDVPEDPAERKRLLLKTAEAR